MTNLPHLKYAEAVTNGNIISNKAVCLQCQRTLDEHKQGIVDGKWIFDKEAAFAPAMFISSLPHVKGSWANKRQKIKLEYWQLYWLAETYGWVHKDNGNRRFHHALLSIARKNAKTTMCAGLAGFELIHGDVGSEVYAIATKSDQSKIVWDIFAKMMARKTIPEADQIRRVHSEITYGENIFKFLGRDSKTLDGLNPSLAIIDEAAQIEDRNLLDVIDSGFGARENPLTIYITTASFETDTAYYDMQEDYLDNLKRGESNGRTFGLIYGLDDDDDYTDPSCWKKANPNLGVSVYSDFLEKRASQASRQKSMRNGVLVKNFNRWTSSGEAWIPREDWLACTGKIEKKGKCYAGIDVAVKLDLTACAVVWPKADGSVELDVKCWVPEKAFEDAKDNVRLIYESAIDEGTLEIVPGAVMDEDLVLEHIQRINEKHQLVRVGSDPACAGQLLDKIDKAGIEVLEVKPYMRVMTAPARRLENLVAEKKLVHEGSEFLAWQADNAVIYVNDDGHCKVKKPPTAWKKIDGIISTIVALACFEEGEVQPEVSIVIAQLGDG